MQQHAASFVSDTEASTGAELRPFIKDEFDAFLRCGILAHGFLRLRCGERGHDKLLAFSCKNSESGQKARPDANLCGCAVGGTCIQSRARAGKKPRLTPMNDARLQGEACRSVFQRPAKSFISSSR